MAAASVRTPSPPRRTTTRSPRQQHTTQPINPLLGTPPPPLTLLFPPPLFSFFFLLSEANKRPVSKAVSIHSSLVWAHLDCRDGGRGGEVRVRGSCMLGGIDSERRRWGRRRRREMVGAGGPLGPKQPVSAIDFSPACSLSKIRYSAGPLGLLTFKSRRRALHGLNRILIWCVCGSGGAGMDQSCMGSELPAAIKGFLKYAEARQRFRIGKAPDLLGVFSGWRCSHASAK